MNARFLSLALCVFLFFFILELIRRDKLTFKYAAGWLIGCVLGVGMAMADQAVVRLSELLGFQLASNFIFYAFLCGFVFLSLLLTVFLCQQNKRNDKMAQKIALLENELEKLKSSQRSSE